MECKVNEPSERLPRSCAALDNVSIPQVAVQKKMIATIFRIFPSLVSSLSSLLSIELVTKEGKKGRERKKKKRVSIGKRGRNLFVSGRKNGRPVEAKPADCLVSGTCVCVCVQINEAVASTSGDSAGKNVTGNQITVTLADK